MELFDLYFLPLPDGGLFWPSHSSLFVADLHLGKEASFCREGIAVPRGSSSQTLTRVQRMLKQCRAESLIILGDLFHARSSLADDVRALFAAFLQSLQPITVTLVRGNHDRAVGALPREWPMKTVETASLGGVFLSHFPVQPASGDLMTLAGHVHPAIRLRGAANEGKLACYHFDASLRCLTLPAVGEFTGTAEIRPAPDDRVWIAVGEEVKELPMEMLHRQRQRRG